MDEKQTLQELLEIMHEHDLDKIKVKVRETPTGRTLADIIDDLNPVITGWRNYYRYATRSGKEFAKHDWWLYWRLKAWLGKKHGGASRRKLRRRYAEPGARQSTMVSVAHQIALAALDAERLYDVDRSAAKADADVSEFASKVEIIADARLDAYYPQHWPAEVDVEAGGEIHQQRIVEAIGDPEHPLDQAGVFAKAHRVLDPLVGNDGAAEWLAMGGAALDDATACRKLAAAFAEGL